MTAATFLARFWPIVWGALFVLGLVDPSPLLVIDTYESGALVATFAVAAVCTVALVVAPHVPPVRYTATVAGVVACATRSAVFVFTPTNDGTTPWLVALTWAVLGLSWVVLIALSWWVLEHGRRTGAADA